MHSCLVFAALWAEVSVPLWAESDFVPAAALRAESDFVPAGRRKLRAPFVSQSPPVTTFPVLLWGRRQTFASGAGRDPAKGLPLLVLVPAGTVGAKAAAKRSQERVVASCVLPAVPCLRSCAHRTLPEGRLPDLATDSVPPRTVSAAPRVRPHFSICTLVPFRIGSKSESLARYVGRGTVGALRGRFLCGVGLRRGAGLRLGFVGSLRVSCRVWRSCGVRDLRLPPNGSLAAYSSNMSCLLFRVVEYVFVVSLVAGSLDLKVGCLRWRTGCGVFDRCRLCFFFFSTSTPRCPYVAVRFMFVFF